MDRLAEVRPKLKRHTVFLQTSAGVFFPGTDVPFLLKGKSISHWMSKISPYLNGQYTLEELARHLGTEQRETLVRLIAQLMEKGLVKDVVPEPADLLSPAVRKRFRAQIEYIDHYTDQPVQRFKTFCESRLLFIGAGESYLALLRALARNGLQHFFLVPQEEPGRYQDALEAECVSARQYGLTQTVELAGLSYQEALSAGRKYDMVVYCADQTCLPALRQLHEWCFAREQTFLPVLFCSGRAQFGPLVRPPQGPCWLCAQLRLAAHEPVEREAAFWRAFAFESALAAEAGPVSPVARRVGNGLAFELFKVLTGVLPPETAQGVILQDLETLESVHCQLLPHPLCPLCARTSAEVENRKLRELVAGEHDCALSQDDLLKQALPRLVNEHTGPFQRFADDDLPQLPLKITKLVACSPVSSQAGRLEGTAYSLENVRQARLAALATMTGLYAQAVPDTRRALVGSMRELRAAGQRVIAPAALTTCTALHQLAPETRLPWYPVYSLSRQQVCYVPAAAIFPTSSLNAGHMFERVQAGASAGTTFQELFEAGLRSALIYEHVRRLMRGEERLIRLNPAEPGEQDRDLAFLLRGARHSGHTISLFEIAHEAPLHVVLACTETTAGELKAIGAGFSGPAALSDALRLLLGDLQVVLATGELPVSRDARTLVSPRAEFLFADPAVSRFAAPACTFEDLEAYTRANGWEILCANTTPSDLWMTRTWMSGTLLLASHGEDADDTASL